LPVSGRLPLSRRAAGIVAACAVGMGVSWSLANVGAVASTEADRYGVGLATIGLFTTVLFLAELFSMAPAGRLIDRVGPRLVSAIALPMVVVANLLTLAVDSVVLALVLRAVVGLGVGMGFLAGAAYVQQVGGGAFGQGLYGGLSLGTGGVAVAVVPALEGSLEWRAPFVSAAVAAALALVAVALGPSTPGRGAGGVARLRLRDRRLLRFAAVMAASFGVGIVLSNWAVEVLEQRGGLDSDTAGLVGSLVLVVGVVARPLGGLAASRRPDRSRALLAGAMVTGATGTLLLGLAEPPALAVAGALAVGAGAGIPFGPTLEAIARAFPSQPGAALGAANAWSLLAIIVGTPLVGLTFDLPGDGLIGFAAVAALWATTLLALPKREAFAVPVGPAAGAAAAGPAAGGPASGPAAGGPAGGPGSGQLASPPEA
jgi:MFS transporter, NNP family, nitrate/nitrite transporter